MKMTQGVELGQAVLKRAKKVYEEKHREAKAKGDEKKMRLAEAGIGSMNLCMSFLDAGFETLKQAIERCHRNKRKRERKIIKAS